MIWWFVRNFVNVLNALAGPLWYVFDPLQLWVMEEVERGPTLIVVEVFWNSVFWMNGVRGVRAVEICLYFCGGDLCLEICGGL